MPAIDRRRADADFNPASRPAVLATARAAVLAAVPAAVPAAVLATVLVAGPVGAQEVYLKGGFPGIGVGVGQALGERLNVRGEFTTLGSIDRTFDEGNVRYDGKFKSDIFGLYLDGFVAGGFRLTGGLSINDVKASGTGVPTGGGTVTINNTTVGYGPEDSVSFSAKMPSVTPYLGIGFGHSPSARGWSFIADLGVNIGKAKARLFASQSIVDKLTLAGQNAQSEIDAEERKLQDRFDKYSVYPIVMIGVAYRF